ncbi:MAG: UvrD-helicase domain-containing protein [Spirochaetia bacterium]|nr:UvrD-helicase domain-containing protein [Spirochaetia bacterium]
MADSDYKYLDLLERKLDPAQKKVCCTTENTIVAAGAGSGKTQVLATRFAWLVMSCNIPSPRILTLTFTKKAASEMYSRIYGTLKYFAENPLTPETEKKRAIQALNDFSETHIQTLDSYCTGIVRQAANRYGIKPDFSAGGGDTSDISRKALQFVLKHRNNPAILHYAEAGKLQAFAENYFSYAICQFTSLANEKGYFSKKLSYQKEFICKEWNKLCDELIKQIEYITACINSLDQFDASTFVGKANYYLEQNISFEAYKIPDSESNASDPDFLNKLNSVIDFVNGLSGCVSGAGTRTAAYQETKNAINALKDFKFSLIYDFFADFNMTTELCRLMDEFLEETNCAKRISGNLTFKDAAEMSLKILNEQQDIREQEQNAFDKIMIDEFQDNNKKNRDLLFLLSTNPETNELRKDKLFFVGDEKQSIYKFRNADVSVFNNLKLDLNAEPLQMSYNYRSKTELLSTFNQLFGGFSSNLEIHYPSILLNQSSDDFEATFPEKARALKVNTKTYEELPVAKLNDKNICTHVVMFNTTFIKDDKDNELLSKENQEAYFIAKKIKELYESGDEKKYSNFAILDRGRSDRKYLTNWLCHFGIPFNLDQQTNIFENAPVNDIYNILRLCVYPSDKKAFAVVLASPFVNLSESALEGVLCLTDTAFENKSEFEELLGAEYKKYEHGVQFFEEIKPLILSQPLTKSLNLLWNNTGYRYETLLNPVLNLQAEQYDLLFEYFRQCDNNSKNISAVVDEMDSLRGSGNIFGAKGSDESDVAYPLEKGDSVQIMTVHKSKGLQFKHIFITGCTGNAKSERSNFVYFSEDLGLTFRSASGEGGNYFFEMQRNLGNAMEAAEFKRLFYVAVTRAEDSVYILGNWSSSDKTLSQFEELIEYYYQTARETEESLGTFRYEADAPFDFLNLKPVTKKEAYDNALYDNTKEILLKKVDELYKDINIIPYERPLSNRKTPSSQEGSWVNIGFENENLESPNSAVLETKLLKGTENRVNTGFENENVELPNSAVLETKLLQGTENSVINGLENESLELPNSGVLEKYDTPADYIGSGNFEANDFGTLVHEYLRAQAEGFSPEEYLPPEKLFKNLDEKQKKNVIMDCINMCHDFADSELGKAAYGENGAKSSGRFIKAEWAFRMFHEKSIWTGSIDLIFENADGTYTIVDYKSDQKLNPDLYKGQQKIYKIAASKLLKIDENKIDCYLFGLREKIICRL